MLSCKSMRRSNRHKKHLAPLRVVSEGQKLSPSPPMTLWQTGNFLHLHKEGMRLFPSTNGEVLDVDRMDHVAVATLPFLVFLLAHFAPAHLLGR